MGTQTLEGFALSATFFQQVLVAYTRNNGVPDNDMSICLTNLRLPNLTCVAACAMLLAIPYSSVRAQESTEEEREQLIVVVGAGGSAEYQSEFARWSEPWQKLAQQRNWNLTLIDEDQTGSAQEAALTHRDRLQQAISKYAGQTQRLWIVLLGHGTFAGKTAKFNLVGPDVSASELATWLEPIESPVVILNCSSASSPFMTELGGPNRVIVTATRAGSEINFARFGKYLSLTLQDLAADIDHDLEVSLLEAFLAAAAMTERFYREDARLTTEHALLDDNGDRAGITGDFYRGAKAVKPAAAGAQVDGQVAKRIILYSSPQAPRFTEELSQQRAELERRIDALRSQKANLPEAEYWNQLEQLLLELSQVYTAAEEHS